MTDPIRLYSNLDNYSGPWPIFGTIISSTVRRSSAQACRACADAPTAGIGERSSSISERIAEEVPNWTYRINKQWISIQSPPGSGSTMGGSADSLFWLGGMVPIQVALHQLLGDGSHGNYNPYLCLLSGRGMMESGSEAGRLLPRFKKRTKTTNYNTHIHTVHFLHVNFSLIICHFSHQLLVSLSWSLRQISHFLPEFSHSCIPNHLITGSVAHSYCPNRTITTFYA